MKKSSYILPFIIQATLWYLIMKPFFKFFTHLEVRGYENIKNEKAPLIFAPNHTNDLDAVLLPLALPFWSKFSPIMFVTREGIYYTKNNTFLKRIFYGGWKFKMIGGFPLVSGIKNYESSLKNHVEMINDGKSLCIFPDGAITKDGSIGKAHGGIIHLARETNTKIVPVHIKGAYKITIKDVFTRKRKIIVNFLKPLTIEDILDGNNPKPEEYNIHADKILEYIRQAELSYN